MTPDQDVLREPPAQPATAWDSFSTWVRALPVVGAFLAWIGTSATKGPVQRRGSLTTDERAFIKSYVALRVVVGFVGLLLPVMVWAGDLFFINLSQHARGSLSAYYHSPMRDWFVAALCIIGGLLITYMIGSWKNFEFWVSTIAGFALMGVAFFPTDRSNVTDATPACTSDPIPRDCNDLEHRFGEQYIADWHKGFAITALLLLAVIAFLFAARSRRRLGHATFRRLAWFQSACGSLILVALVVAGLGTFKYTDWRFGRWTPLYAGEVLTVVGFGLCWIAQGWDLNRWLKQVPKADVVASPLGAPPAEATSDVAE